MKTKSKVRPMVALCTSFVCLLIACQLYEPFTEEEVFKGAYERNFVRQFGLIAPSQDWDFTNETSSERSENNPKTRVGEWSDHPFVPISGGYFEIDGSLISEIKKLSLPDKADKSFALELAENDSIEIYPLYRATFSESNIGWIFQIFADDQNITSTESSPLGWVMSTGMKVKLKKNDSYKELGNNECTTWGVCSKPIVRYANNTGHSQLLYFNLYVNKHTYEAEHQKLAPTGTQQSSLNYQMRIVNLSRPANIDARYDVMFVACESANFDPNNPVGTSVPRYHSFVFMIVGPRQPKVLYLQQDGENQPYVHHTLARKRYMVEDLGSSSDFDFNDVVLDVEQFGQVPVIISQELQSKYNNAIKTTVSLGACSDPHEAVCVRHLCGTRPFQFKVGDYESAIITDPTDEVQTLKQLNNQPVETTTYFGGSQTIEGWNPDQTIPITGWLPDENNISLKVWRSGQQHASEGGWQVQFPKEGAVPFVMALPVSVPWSAEGVNFTGWQQFVP